MVRAVAVGGRLPEDGAIPGIARVARVVVEAESGLGRRGVVAEHAARRPFPRRIADADLLVAGDSGALPVQRAAEIVGTLVRMVEHVGMGEEQC